MSARRACVGDAAERGVTARVIQIYAGCYAVTCNGNAVGHECSGRADVVIEPGDTWGQAENALAYAEAHIAEHETREV